MSSVEAMRAELELRELELRLLDAQIRIQEARLANHAWRVRNEEALGIFRERERLEDEARAAAELAEREALLSEASA